MRITLRLTLVWRWFVADFSKWSRESLEALAVEMLQALIRAQDWIERDEGLHGRAFGVGNEVRNVLNKIVVRESPDNTSGERCQDCNKRLGYEERGQRVCELCSSSVPCPPTFVSPLHWLRGKG